MHEYSQFINFQDVLFEEYATNKGAKIKILTKLHWFIPSYQIH